MGRSRGGLTTRIPIRADAQGRPIEITITEGQAHDGRSALAFADHITPGATLLADRACDSDAFRQTLAERGVRANIPPMPNRVRHPVFSPWLYRHRNAIARFFSKFTHSRAVATRSEKRDDHYLAAIQLASLRIWLRSYGSVTWSASRDRGLTGSALTI